MTGDKKFAIIITLFAVIALSLALGLLSMVLLDERGHSDGSASTRGGGRAPLQGLPLLGN